MSVQNPIIKIRNLQYAYANEELALDDINVDIYQGERIAVMGANGAGKSTFFLNLNGVLTSEKGEITYRDKLISSSKSDLNILRKAIGIVFQDADNQMIASTVQSEVAFGPLNLKLPKEEVVKRVDEALKYMNILEFKDRPPHYLSGGEKKRVSIADIIAMHSEVIVFDEPTASLDPVNAKMLEEVLEKLSKQGKTIIISTHDVDFAFRWAERILVFSKGKMIADGKPREIFRNQDVLERANLRKPVLLEVWDILKDKGMLEGKEDIPKSIEEFRKM